MSCCCLSLSALMGCWLSPWYFYYCCYYHGTARTMVPPCDVPNCCLSVWCLPCRVSCGGLLAPAVKILDHPTPPTLPNAYTRLISQRAATTTATLRAGVVEVELLESGGGALSPQQVTQADYTRASSPPRQGLKGSDKDW